MATSQDISHRNHIWRIRLYAGGKGRILDAILPPIFRHLDNRPPLRSSKPLVLLAHPRQQPPVERQRGVAGVDCKARGSRADSICVDRRGRGASQRLSEELAGRVLMHYTYLVLV